MDEVLTQENFVKELNALIEKYQQNKKLDIEVRDNTTYNDYHYVEIYVWKDIK